MTKSRWMVLPLVGLSLALGACGDDESSKDSAAPAAETASTETTAQAAVEAPPTTPPTEIGVSEPLSSKPDAGKDVIFLQCEIPSCARFAPGLKEGAAALGWNVKVLSFKNAAPAAGLDQAIAQKPDFIAMTGIPAAALKPQLAAAAAADIPVVSCGTTDEAAPKGYAAECQGTLALDAEYLAKWIVNDTDGAANAVSVSIPQFPALVTETDWLKDNFSGLCDECSFDELDVSVEDLGAGAVASKVVAYLQSHPDVNYVLFTLGDLSTGVPEALKTAGLADKVKLVAAIENDATIKGITDGTVGAVTLSPNEYQGWVMVDAMARLATDGELSQDYLDGIYVTPTWVLDDPAQAEALGQTENHWYGPEGYADQFKELWGV